MGERGIKRLITVFGEQSPKQGARRARPVLRRRATMRRDGAVFALALGTATGMCLQYLSVPIPRQIRFSPKRRETNLSSTILRQIFRRFREESAPKVYRKIFISPRGTERGTSRSDRGSGRAAGVGSARKDIANTSLLRCPKQVRT